MQKTSNYNLKKPEPTDPLRVADFNENSDIIDVVLSGKAEKSAVTAVETALANYKTSNNAAVASATAKANAAYSSSNSPFTIVTIDTTGKVSGDTMYTFDVTPKFIVLQGNYSNAFLVDGKSVYLVDVQVPNVTTYALFRLFGTSLVLESKMDQHELAAELTMIIFH